MPEDSPQVAQGQGALEQGQEEEAQEQINSDKEDGESVNLDGDPERKKAPANQAIVDLHWPSESDEDQELKVQYGPSRMTGPPGNEWMDQYPLSFGIAPYWQHLFAELKREANVWEDDVWEADVFNRDGDDDAGDDVSGEDKTQEAAGESPDLEAGLRPASEPKADLREPSFRYNWMDLENDAYGLVREELTEAIIFNHRNENSEQLLKASKSGDVILVNLLRKEIRAPLEEITDDDGLTPLHCAAMRGHMQCCKSLVSSDTLKKARTRRGPNLGSPNFGGGLPGGFAADYLYTCQWHWHLWLQHEDLLMPDPSVWDDEYFQPRNLLFESFRTNDEVVFNQLLEAISFESGLIDDDRLNQKDSTGLNLLETSLVTPDSPWLDRLIEVGARLPKGRPLRLTSLAFPSSASFTKLDKLLAKMRSKILTDEESRLELAGMELTGSLLKRIQTEMSDSGPAYDCRIAELSLVGSRFHKDVDVHQLPNLVLPLPDGFGQTALRAVDFSGIPIGDKGFHDLLERLSSGGSFPKLELRDCNIGNEGFSSAIRWAFQFRHHLDLRSNKIASAYKMIIELLSGLPHKANFKLLLFGNRVKAARLQAMMRKSSLPAQEGSTQNLYEVMGQRVDILADELALRKACDERLDESKRSSTGAKVLFTTRAAYLPKIYARYPSSDIGEEAEPELEGEESSASTRFCPESRVVSVTTPLLQGHQQEQGQEKLRQAELLALRAPYSARKTRQLAAQRPLPLTWSDREIEAWQRARTWPASATPVNWLDRASDLQVDITKSLKLWTSDAPTKPEEKHKVILKELSVLLKLESENVKWPTDSEAERHGLTELQRIAEKKLHDMAFAQEAAAKKQCPGDLTPVRPRTYQAFADTGVDPAEKVELEETRAAEVRRKIESLDDDVAPWPATKSEVMREWLNQEPQEPWTADLSEPIWEVFEKRLLDVEVTQQGPSKKKRRRRKKKKEDDKDDKDDKQKTKGQAKAKPAAKKKVCASQRLRTMEVDDTKDILKVMGAPSEGFQESNQKLALEDLNYTRPYECWFDDAPPPELVQAETLKQRLEQSSRFWFALHFVVVTVSSIAATFWTIGLKMAIDTIEQNYDYDIPIPDIWAAGLPSQAWATRALSLSMLSALIAATPLQVGHYLWYRSTKAYYMQGSEVQGLTTSEHLSSTCSPFLLALTIIWALAVPVLAIPVALAHAALCVLGPSQLHCAEGTMHLLRSEQFASPRSAGYSDMLHAALASSVVALAVSEAIILYRTREGHFVVPRTYLAAEGSVLVTGGPGAVGRQVNGVYIHIDDREWCNGRPVFQRRQGSQSLYLSDHGWQLRLRDKMPAQVDFPMTERLPPWLHVQNRVVEVQLFFGNQQWRETRLHKITGEYARGGAGRDRQIFRKKGLEDDSDDLPICLVPTENGGRAAIAKAAFPQSSEQWMQQVDAIIRMENSVDSEALQTAMRGFDLELYKMLEDLKSNYGDEDQRAVFVLPLAHLLEMVARARLEEGPSSHTAERQQMNYPREEVAKAAEKEIQALEGVTKGGSEFLEVTFILYVFLLLSGQEIPPEVDRKKPPGLCEWSIVEGGGIVKKDDVADELNCSIKSMGGTGSSDLKDLSKAVWQLDVSDSIFDTAWWCLPELKATYIPPAKWQPRIGDYAYNFHSPFGVQLACKSAAVLIDVGLDFAVVSKFIAGGYPYFTAISLFLIIAPSVACWAFLYSNGMMEVRDLSFCLSQTAVVMETYEALGSGQVGQNLLWVAVAEACLESLSQTMFQTYCLLIGYGQGSAGSTQVLIASVMWGMVNVALVVSMLDHYGRSYTSMGTSLLRWLTRYCEVASRVSTLALFAFFLRPSAVGTEMHKSKQRAIFILLALDFVVLLRLLLSRDKSRGLVNVFWAMISCFLAPPCFIGKFRAFQPVYYTWRLVELVAMLAACFISGQSIDKVLNHPEAYIFLHIAVISTSLFIFLNLIVACWHLRSYLHKLTFKRIVKVRVWILEKRCMAHQASGDLLPVRGIEFEYDNGTTKRVYEERDQTSDDPGSTDAQRRASTARTASQGSLVAPSEESPDRLSCEDLDALPSLGLSLRRGEELVGVARFNWRWNRASTRRTGVLFTTSFGRTWGPRLVDRDDIAERDE